MTIETVLSVTVGILSMLVTVLIGWQIFTLIDIRKIKKKIRKHLQISIRKSDKAECIAMLAASDFYLALIKKEPMEDAEYRYVYYRLLSLSHAMDMNDYDTCNAIIDMLLRFDKLRELKLTQYKKQQLQSLLQEVKASERLQNFHTLSQIVHQIPDAS